MSDEEIKDFLRLSPIYERLSPEERKALVEEVKIRYSDSSSATKNASDCHAP